MTNIFYPFFYYYYNYYCYCLNHPHKTYSRVHMSPPVLSGLINVLFLQVSHICSPVAG